MNVAKQQNSTMSLTITLRVLASPVSLRRAKPNDHSKGPPSARRPT